MLKMCVLLKFLINLHTHVLLTLDLHFSNKLYMHATPVIRTMFMGRCNNQKLFCNTVLLTRLVCRSVCDAMGDMELFYGKKTILLLL